MLHDLPRRYVIAVRRAAMLRCFNHAVRGTCTNTRAISRAEVEARVLRAMQERFFEPGVFDEFCRAFTEEMNRLRREHRTTVAAAPREIAAIDRRQQQILNYLVDWLWRRRGVEARGA